MRIELVIVLDWYNQHRPHSTLGGKTPLVDQAYGSADSVLAVDRIEYMTAIGDAIRALETARVTLAKMVASLEKNKNRNQKGE